MSTNDRLALAQAILNHRQNRDPTHVLGEVRLALDGASIEEIVEWRKQRRENQSG